MAEYIDSITPYLESSFDEIHPMDFYRLLFPEGVLQKKAVKIDREGDEKTAYDEDGNIIYKKNEDGSYEGDGHYSGLMIELTGRYRTRKDPETGEEKKKRIIKRYSVTDDLEVLDEVMERDNFCLMSPLAYAGRTREADNARVVFGITIDLDKIRIRGGFPEGIANFMHQTGSEPSPQIGSQPLPTAIVSSGTGCHLYYMFEKPICLFEETITQMQKLKRALTTKAWHDSIVDIADERDIQQEGIFQGFRVVGTITKVGTRTRAFSTGSRVSVEYLNQFVPEESRVSFYREYEGKYILSKEPYPKQLTLEDELKFQTKLTYWKERDPDWYQRRVVNKEPRKTWAVNRALYDWWKGEIFNKARVSHRYWCIAMLAIYAVKCSHYDPEKNPDPVTYEELEEDAFALVDRFESLTVSEDNHFTEADVLAALEFWNDKNNWSFYKRDYMSYRAGFEIKKTKRNYRTLEDHLEVCRLTKKQKKARGELRNPDGRPVKMIEVLRWKAQHPEGTIEECVQETEMAKATVEKWWVFAWQREHPEGTAAECAADIGIKKGRVDGYWRWLSGERS